MSNQMWGDGSAPRSAAAQMPAALPHLFPLYAEDIEGSKAHTAMLADTQILSRTEASAIMRGLDDIRAEIETGIFKCNAEHDGVPSHIEHRLAQLVGDTAQRLGTARSHGDQLATDLRLWARTQCARIDEQLMLYQHILARKALEHAASVMPGVERQPMAQPMTFGHYLLSFVERARRDRARFKDAAARMNECPLGASALGGTSFPIDRAQTAQLLRFEKPMQNSIDAVSARDFILEILSASAICASHLKQLGEDLTLWSAVPFSYVTAQDRNGEAVGARQGRIIGALIAVLSASGGASFGHARNTQDAHDPLFNALGTLSLSIEIMTRLVESTVPDVKAMRRAAEQRFSSGPDLADWLVRVAKLSVRQAQAVTSRLVKKAETRGVPLCKFSLAELQAEHAAITDDVYNVLKAASAVKSRVSEGGTAPKNVKTQAKRWLKILALKS